MPERVLRPVRYVESPFRYAMFFDGVDDYVVIKHSDSLMPSEITLIAWVNAFEDGLFRRIITKETGTNTDSYSLIRYAYKARIYPKLTVYLESRSYTLNRTWYHIAASYIKSTGLTRIYINGMLDNSGTITGGLPYTTYDVYVGNNPQINRQWYGYISQVLIYNRALSDSEIAWNYQNTNSPVTDGLVLWLHAHPDNVRDIDNDGIPEWVDLSGYDNHGKIYGATLMEITKSPITVRTARRIQPVVR
jgi:hypothetical protein